MNDLVNRVMPLPICTWKVSLDVCNMESRAAEVVGGRN